MQNLIGLKSILIYSIMLISCSDNILKPGEVIMGKFDFSGTIKKVQDSYKKDARRSSQIGLGSSLEEVSHDPADYVVLPSWFKENTGVLGLKFGHFVQIAGDPDSGKTSLSLLSMRAAQDQGYGVVYVETEGKTSEQDLIAAG